MWEIGFGAGIVIIHQVESSMFDNQVDPVQVPGENNRFGAVHVRNACFRSPFVSEQRYQRKFCEKKWALER